MDVKITNNQWIIIILCLFCIIGVPVIYKYVLSDNEQTTINFISLCGTFVSLIGLFITYIQVISLKQATEKTKLEIDNTLNRVNQIISISELSKGSKIIHEIQSANRSSNYELSLIRMQDLKAILIQVKNQQNEDLIKDKFKTAIKNLGIDIGAYDALLTKQKTGIDITKVNSNLEKLSTTLIEFENKLKFER